MTAMLDLFLPRDCHLCGRHLLSGERFVCQQCLAALPRTLFHRSKLNPMEQKLVSGPPFIRATGHFFYSAHNPLAILIQDFKYRSYPSLAKELGRLIGRELLPTGFFNDIDILQPIPMNFLKKGNRGYNQAEMLAVGVSMETGIPIGDNLRTRRRHSSQTRLSEQEREANMSDYFRVHHPEEIRGRSIMLIDDVCTTGATLRNAARPLSEIQGVRISYLTLATT